MSASEKLRALQQFGSSMGAPPRYAIGGNPVPDNIEAWKRYRDALPLIADEVRRAEELVEYLTSFESVVVEPNSHLSRLADALLALQEHLEGDDFLPIGHPTC